MRRRWTAVAVTALLAGTVVVGTGTSAPAVNPPMTGNVACALDGNSSFRPPLGFSPGRGDHRINPDVDSKWKLKADLSGCTGAQTGGIPRLPGPIASADVLLKATAVDHTCQKASDFGMTATLARIRWFDALGRHLKMSKGTGTVTFEGLGNGSPFLSFPFGDPDPNYVPPGVITLHVTVTISPTSLVFPGRTLSMTTVADQTISQMFLPCSLQGPPLTVGITGLSFSGVQGASSLSVG